MVMPERLVPGNDHRDRAEDDLQHQARALIDASPHQFPGAAEHHADFAPGIDHHGAERTDMDGNVQQEALILPLHHMGDEDKMAAG